MTTEQMIEVLQAYKDKKEIEWRAVGMEFWNTKKPEHNVLWDFTVYEFRVKSQPIEGWINIYPEGKYDVCYSTEDRANRNAMSHRIACIHLKEVDRKTYASD